MAAREVFLKEGFNASTVEIARKAKISEGSLFKHFPTKDALFHAAMKVPPIPPCIDRLSFIVGVGDLRTNILQTCIQFVEFLQIVVPQFMIAQGRKPLQPPKAIEAEPPPVRDRRLLATYLREEMNRGRLRPCVPEVVAYTLLGCLMGYVMDMSFFHLTPTREETVTFVENLVCTLWDGISPLEQR